MIETSENNAVLTLSNEILDDSQMEEKKNISPT